MKIITIFLLLICLSAHSQLITETSYGELGEKANVFLRVFPQDSSLDLNMQFILEISNPSVFYPIDLHGDNYRIPEYSLERINDSIYCISFRCNLLFTDTLKFHIEGYALAGNDSICELNYNNVILNQIPIKDASSVLIIRSIGNVIPYIRQPVLEDIYPNPTSDYEIELKYHIDYTSDCIMELFNLNGKKLIEDKLGLVNSGWYTYKMPIADFCTGFYFARLRTDYGSTKFQPLFISR